MVRKKILKENPILTLKRLSLNVYLPWPIDKNMAGTV
jgi:hypothetical protein